MRKVIILIFLATAVFSCKKKQQEEAVVIDETVYLKPELNDKSAMFLYHFAFECIENCYIKHYIS